MSSLVYTCIQNQIGEIMGSNGSGATVKVDNLRTFELWGQVESMLDEKEREG